MTCFNIRLFLCLEWSFGFNPSVHQSLHLMGTDRLNLLKLSVRVGFGCMSGMCGWCLCAMDLQCVCVFVLHIWFIDIECLQGLCVSSGWDVPWLCMCIWIVCAVLFYTGSALYWTLWVKLSNQDHIFANFNM